MGIKSHSYNHQKGSCPLGHRSCASAMKLLRETIDVERVVLQCASRMPGIGEQVIRNVVAAQMVHITASLSKARFGEMD